MSFNTVSMNTCTMSSHEQHASTWKLRHLFPIINIPPLPVWICFKTVIYRSLFVVPCGLPREMEIYWLACRSQRPECCGSSIVSRENGCKAPTDLDGTHGAWWVHSSQIWVDLGDIWVVYIRLWICWSAYRYKQYINHQMVFRQLNHQRSTPVLAENEGGIWSTTSCDFCTCLQPVRCLVIGRGDIVVAV